MVATTKRGKANLRIGRLRTSSKPAHYRSRSSQQERMHTTALSDGAIPSTSTNERYAPLAVRGSILE